MAILATEKQSYGISFPYTSTLKRAIVTFSTDNNN